MGVGPGKGVSAALDLGPWAVGLGLGHDQAGERCRTTLTQKLETCVDGELGGMVVCHQGDPDLQSHSGRGLVFHLEKAGAHVPVDAPSGLGTLHLSLVVGPEEGAVRRVEVEAVVAERPPAGDVENPAKRF